MKFTRLTLSLLSTTSFLAFEWVSSYPAAAGCVQADVSVQYNISGSRRPTNRSNEVEMESEPSCMGNTSVTTGVQGNVGGTGPVEQHRRVRHRQEGSRNNTTGIGGSTIQIRSNVGVDVYNPADKLID